MAKGFESYTLAFTSKMPAPSRARIEQLLDDTDGTRLQVMNQAGIRYMVLSQTGPGLQAEPNRDKAESLARQGNDELAQRIARHPDRYFGFAALPMHDPSAAVSELKRCSREHGFRGCLVNGHTLGQYYDAPQYDALWEALQDLNLPLYLHPVDAVQLPVVLKDFPVLTGAAWGWAFETGSHALRLLFSGVFDRFSRLTIILGHMGEGLPYQRFRFDSRFAAYPQGVTLQRRPSEYIGSNIVITTSGVCSHGALVGALAEMGSQAVMFSVDYPYEDSAVAADFIDSAPLPVDTLNAIRFENAARLLSLPQA